MAITLVSYQHILLGMQQSIHCLLEAPHPFRSGEVVRDTLRLDDLALLAIAQGRNRDTWDQFDVAALLTATLGVEVVVAPLVLPEVLEAAAPEVVSYAEVLAREFPNAVPATPAVTTP